MATLDLVLLILAGLSVLLWLAAPLVVRLTFRHEIAPVLEAGEPWDVPDLPASFLEPRVEELEALGFSDCGRARVSATRGGTLWFALLRNDHDQHMACVSVGVLEAPGTGPRIQMGQVELATVWPDGREILTSNLAQAVAFTPLPKHDLLQVPGEEDLGILLQIHEARVRRSARGLPANPRPGEEIASVEATFHRTLEHQVDSGWLWRDEARGIYRATLRGALHMTSTQLFPYAQLARRRIAKHARRALAEIGLRLPVTRT